MASLKTVQRTACVNRISVASWMCGKPNVMCLISLASSQWMKLLKMTITSTSLVMSLLLILRFYRILTLISTVVFLNMISTSLTIIGTFVLHCAQIFSANIQYARTTIL